MCPRLTPSTGVPLSQVTSAARRIDPSPPTTTASSQPAATSLSAPASSIGGSYVAGSMPRSAASSLQHPHDDVVLGQRLAEAERHVPGGVPPGVREQEHAPGRTRVGRLRCGHGSSLSDQTPTTGSAPHRVVDVVLGRPWPGRGAATGRTRRCPTGPATGCAPPPGHPSPARRPARPRPPPPRPAAPGHGPRRPCRPAPCRPRTEA